MMNIVMPSVFTKPVGACVRLGGWVDGWMGGCGFDRRQRVPRHQRRQGHLAAQVGRPQVPPKPGSIFSSGQLACDPAASPPFKLAV